MEDCLYWFEKHPKKALVLFALALFVVIDLMVGSVYKRATKGELAYRRDSKFHHVLRENFQGEQKWGEDSFTLYTNDLGFKDSKVRKVPKKSAERIGLLGDSFIEGPGLPYDQTAAGVMEGRGINVLSLGTSSHSPKLYYARVKDLIEKGYEFHEIFVFIDVSDILDEVRYASFEPGDDDDWYTSLARVNAWLLHHSLIYSELLYEPIKAKLFPKILSEQQEDSTQNEEATPFVYEYYSQRGAWLYDKEIYDTWGATGMQSAQHNVEQMRDLFSEYGIKMTLVIYPWNDNLHLLEEESLQQILWKEFAQKNNVPLIDLFEKTALYEGDPQELFLDGDIHWSHAGSDFVVNHLLPLTHEPGADQEPL